MLLRLSLYILVYIICMYEYIYDIEFVDEMALYGVFDGHGGNHIHMYICMYTYITYVYMYVYIY
jgi:serine/threonine protein phosphatase PrpC